LCQIEELPAQRQFFGGIFLEGKTVSLKNQIHFENKNHEGREKCVGKVGGVFGKKRTVDRGKRGNFHGSAKAGQTATLKVLRRRWLNMTRA